MQALCRAPGRGWGSGAVSVPQALENRPAHGKIPGGVAVPPLPKPGLKGKKEMCSSLRESLSYETSYSYLSNSHTILEIPSEMLHTLASPEAAHLPSQAPRRVLESWEGASPGLNSRAATSRVATSQATQAGPLTLGGSVGLGFIICHSEAGPRTTEAPSRWGH